MLLRRFTDRAALAAGLATFLVLAGCGSPGSVRDSEAPRERAGNLEAGAGDAESRVIPAEALTLFEQAASEKGWGE